MRSSILGGCVSSSNKSARSQSTWEWDTDILKGMRVNGQDSRTPLRQQDLGVQWHGWWYGGRPLGTEREVRRRHFYSTISGIIGLRSLCVTGCGGRTLLFSEKFSWGPKVKEKAVSQYPPLSAESCQGKAPTPGVWRQNATPPPSACLVTIRRGRKGKAWKLWLTWWGTPSCWGTARRDEEGWVLFVEAKWQRFGCQPERDTSIFIL